MERGSLNEEEEEKASTRVLVHLCGDEFLIIEYYRSFKCFRKGSSVLKIMKALVIEIGNRSFFLGGGIVPVEHLVDLLNILFRVIKCLKHMMSMSSMHDMDTFLLMKDDERPENTNNTLVINHLKRSIHLYALFLKLLKIVFKMHQ